MRQPLLSAVCLLLLSGCGSDEPSLAQIAQECTADGQMSCARPILNVSSLEQSQHYYRDVLGFTVDWDWGEPPSFGSVSRDHVTIFMCEGCQGTPGAWMMVFTPNVDALHEEFQARGAKIRMAPTNMPWGLRELHITDPDGNVIRFGHSTE